ncbi:uncharacterized protein LOC144443102 [Glandiceps talaboti]
MLGDIVEDDKMDVTNIASGPISMDDTKCVIDKLCSPPLKRMKQARLPFKPLDASSPLPTNQQSKKRKLSENEKICQSPKTPKISKDSSVCIVAEKSTFNAKLAAFKYQKDADYGENEVSSSSETDRALSAAELSCNITNKSKKITLDYFVQKAQQPLVSTSEADLIDLTDDGNNTAISNSETSSKTNASTTGMAKCLPQSQELISKSGDEKMKAKSVDVVSSNYDDAIEAVVRRARQHSDEDGDTSIEGDSEENSDQDSSVSLETTQSPEKSQENQGTSVVTPNQKTGLLKKTPKSAKTLAKEAERAKKREEREKEKREKQTQKEKEKAEKLRQKEEAKAEKEKEREEQRKQKEEEKQKKEQEKREKKEKEEKERLEKLRLKEEEKKQKMELIEAKNEEKKKKDEEKKKLEDEKRKVEEEKQKKQEKQQNVFKGFFKKVESNGKGKEETIRGPFMPFQIQQDMVLAPKYRVEKSIDELIYNLDQYLDTQDAKTLYITELRSGKIQPGKTGKTTMQPEKQSSDNAECMQANDIEILEEESDVPAPKKSKKSNENDFKGRAKLLQFHENYRPAYWGTCMKKSLKVNARNPYRKDEDMVDYEFDSDEEWEEPGESLSNSEGEDENNESDSDSDEDGFFVPHGYLSEDEGCEQEEDLDSFKAKRSAKAQAWEAELKRQCQPMQPSVLGCVWAGDELTDKQTVMMKTLQKYRVMSFVSVPIATSFTVKNPEDGCLDGNSGDTIPQRSNSSIKKPVPLEALPDLIRLVHGNISGIKTLIKEFREFWKQKLNKPVGAETDTTKTSNSPNKAEPQGDLQENSTGNRSNTSVTGSRPTTPLIEDSGEYVISKRQVDLKINAIAVREKRSAFKKTCWYVHQQILEEYKMSDLPVPNQWAYISKTTKTVSEATNKDTDVGKISERATPSITQFTRPVSPAALFEKAKSLKTDSIVTTTCTPVKPILAAFQNQTPKSAPIKTPSKVCGPQSTEVDGYTADSDSDSDDCVIMECGNTLPTSTESNAATPPPTSYTKLADKTATPPPTLTKQENKTATSPPSSTKQENSTPMKSQHGQQTLLSMFKPGNLISVKPIKPPSDNMFAVKSPPVSKPTVESVSTSSIHIATQESIGESSKATDHISITLDEDIQPMQTD